MIARVEIVPKATTFDGRGAEVVRTAATLGVTGVEHVAVQDLFFLEGPELDDATVATIVDRILLDPVVAEARVVTAEADAAVAGARVVEVAPLPGTTDSEAESLMGAVASLGLSSVRHAATGTRYVLQGGLDDATLRRLAAGVLANEVVERFVVDAPVPPPFVEGTDPDDTIEHITLRGLDDDALLALSKERRLSMDLAEMKAVQSVFEREGREPTDAELEMFAQTWSEHCVHKTFKAKVTVHENGGTHVVDSIYKTYIKAATEASHSDWLVSVFVDNAGIVKFVDGWDLAFKAETHNHPSALEPFGGANTGVGGVIRDVLGVSARPIATTDTLCFGPPDLPFASLPEGVLHPARIAAGVIAGIGDYGNKMGIPTVDGAIRYDAGYTANPLVYAGCLGVLPHGSHRTTPEVGDRVISIGGRTGRDGLRGATFSSMEMDVETQEHAGSSVQIGHPIHEKQVLEVIVRARDAGLYNAVTDCGAGGLSSAVGEMGETLGVEIQLQTVPLKYSGLRPWEVWLSEAQERMVLAVPPRHLPAFQALCDDFGVELTNLGHFTGDRRLSIRHGDAFVADLAMDDLHEGIPQKELVAQWEAPGTVEPDASVFAGKGLGDWLLELLATPNLRSKEDVVRTYDHEVQGGTICKPFVGPSNDGPGDAAVLRPLDVVEATGEPGGPGVALSVGINPDYGKLDPEGMAWAVIDEAVRNAVAVGADPDQIALLDNFCWGNPNLPDRMGGLVMCARGCHDAAVSWGMPFISGKDSLNNEYLGSDCIKHAIPGTLLVSAMGIVPDVDRTATMAPAGPGEALIVVGVTADELGASALYVHAGELGANLPRPRVPGLATARAVHGLIRDGLVRTVHDVSDGGLLVAVAEMAFAGRVGCELDLGAVPWEADGRTDLSVAYSESLTRWVLSVSSDDVDTVLAALGDVPCDVVGRTVASERLTVRGLDGEIVADVSVADIGTAWRGHVI